MSGKHSNGRACHVILLANRLQTSFLFSLEGFRGLLNDKGISEVTTIHLDHGNSFVWLILIFRGRFWGANELFR